MPVQPGVIPSLSEPAGQGPRSSLHGRQRRFIKPRTCAYSRYAVMKIIVLTGFLLIAAGLARLLDRPWIGDWRLGRPTDGVSTACVSITAHVSR